MSKDIKVSFAQLTHQKKVSFVQLKEIKHHVFVDKKNYWIIVGLSKHCPSQMWHGSLYLKLLDKKFIVMDLM